MSPCDRRPFGPRAVGMLACLSASLAATTAFTVPPGIGRSGRFAKADGMTAVSPVAPVAGRAWTTQPFRPAAAAPLRMSAVAEEQDVGTEESETFEFQAEVGRVMDIIINSLYSNRDVFLRELISNAADACDKARFLSVTDGGDGAGPEYKIRIKADKDAKTLTISDSGVGMTKGELQNNLGKIAESGTARFMDALGKGEADVSLIGQFGVGFYSAFLVAEKVTVETCSAQEEHAKMLKWESEAGKSYTIASDVKGEPFEGGHGTRITLHLKEDSEEYLDDYKLKELCTRYSEFVSFPIEVWTEQTRYDKVEDPEAEGEDKTKTVSKTEWDWELMNKLKPIWMRNPKEVSEDEYNEFYKSTFKAWDELAAHSHFSLEGQVEFRALLFCPSVLPYQLTKNMFDEDSRNMRLYVKRVFINDKFDELLPRWLMFLRGVVDSEDLPLNVGREILQRSRMLSIISKRLVRKAIDMFKNIEKDEESYKTFWENFGKYLKVGIVEEDDLKDELAKLVRFWSTADTENVVSLPSYVERMKEKQPHIYYVTGESKELATMSPSLEKARSLGYEVLMLVDPLDELTAQSIETFDGKRLVDLAKEGVELTDDAAKENAKKDEAEDFREWLKGVLGESRVSKVEVSTRLVDSPAMLAQSAYGMSPTMQRYMRAQSVAHGEQDPSYGSQAPKAIMEINLDHPVIKSLQASYKANSEEAKETATLLYDVASLTGGYTIDDPASFAKRVTSMLATQAGDAAAAAEATGFGDDAPGDDSAPETAEAEVVG